ncbi:MAG TPA: trigger factor, partial [Opitutales bacterium]|nr:trigger factor [Opitutales bacterium]
IVDASKADFKANEAGTIIFTVDVLPEFELPVYKGLEVEAPAVVVADAEVDAAIEDLRAQRANFEVVERSAQSGDYVKVTYVGHLGDELVKDILPGRPVFGSQERTWEEAGSEGEGSVQAISQGLIGMTIGDKKEVTENFPADFREEALAGKSVRYSLEVHEVRAKVKPELNEEFFKSVEAENLEALRERVRKELENRQSAERRYKISDQIVKKLQTQVSFPVPESAVEEETRQGLTDFMRQVMASGAKREDLEKQKEQLISQARERAENQVRVNLMLAKIAEAEKIEITNPDIERAVYTESMMTRMPVEQLIQELQKDRSRVMRLRQRVMIRKTLDLLIDTASIKELAATKA